MPQIYAMRSSEMTAREIEHMNLSRKIADECIVLLENDGALPLEKGGRLALFGAGARQTIKGGTGSGDVYTRSSVSIEQGMTEAGYRITTTDWLDRQEAQCIAAKKAYLEWVPRAAKEQNCMELQIFFAHPYKDPAPLCITEEDIQKADTDTAIYVLSRNSGEGADRYCREGDYLLYPEEKEHLVLLGQTFAKVILVLNIGGVMDLTEVRDIPGINAIVLMSQLGNIGGLALADVLTGEVSPSGKLADTWAKRYEDYPSSKEFSHNDGNVDDEYYTEGIYVGYRYFDTFGVKPLYPFGYGKSYAEFEIQTEEIQIKDLQVLLKIKVKNISSKYSGKEVIQVYYSAPAGKLHKPLKELAVFGKTSLLKPGETDVLKLSFPIRQMASYCEECASWILEKGNYIVRVGNSSDNAIPAVSLSLAQTIKTEKLKNLFHEEKSVVELFPSQTTQKDYRSLPHLSIDSTALVSEEVFYQNVREEYTTDKEDILTLEDVQSGKCTVEELTAQLTVEEMATLCVGTLRMDREGSIVGNASYMIPGAAGDTSDVIYQSRGVKNMILADGPAGIRLQPIFKTTKDGKLLPGGAVMGDAIEPFDPDLKEEEVDTYYQYCTAIPVGWALAQSWNQELLFDVGSMVGAEMELFGIDLWLAPALNIHRNPLCGRNFEYYSEDPYLSGKVAAAITKGVQSHSGKGVTIKHFAANNQEDNRYFTNSHVSERALREIYLKGFEIAVKEAKPMSIMTSYNLLNGIHTANSYDLLQAAARDEWGFDGVVMTDWFTSQYLPMMTGNTPAIYPISASTGCIYAGNDIQMPGSQGNVDDIIEAVSKQKEIDGFRITKADLQFNAANVIRVASQISGRNARTLVNHSV